MSQPAHRIRAAAVQVCTTMTTTVSKSVVASFALSLAAIALTTTLGAQSKQTAVAGERWSATWATAQQIAPTRLPIGRGDVQPPPAARVPPTLKDQTVRMIAHVSVGGRRVRVRLSNALGKSPLRVGAAH